MTSLARHNTPITLIGLICSTVVALIFYFFYGELANQQATLMSLILGFGLHLTIWRLNDKFGNFSMSLLVSLFGIVVLSLIPKGLFLLCIILVVTLLLYLKKLWASISTKSLTTGTKLWFLFALGTVYGIIVFVSTCAQVGDGLINEKIRQFTLNPDTLFHSSMSLMIRNYFTVSTGMNGLVQVHYHFLSHTIYAFASKLLNIEPYEVYGYANFIVFGPLLITAWLSAMISISHNTKHSFFICNLLLIGGPLCQTFGYLSNTHFISESYLMGLLILAGFTFSMNQYIEQKKLLVRDVALSALYIFLLMLAKISIGVVAATSMGILILLLKIHEHKNKIQKSLKSTIFTVFFQWLIITIPTFAGYLLTRIPAIKNLEAKFQWGWYQDIYTHESRLLHFIYTQFPYFVILLPLFIIYQTEKKWTYSLGVWASILLASFVIGFTGLNLTIVSSGYYFSNIQMFLGLALLTLLLTSEKFQFSMLFAKIKSDNEFKKSVLYFYIFTALYLFFIRYTPSAAVILVSAILLLYSKSPLKKYIQSPQFNEVYYANIFLFFLAGSVWFFIQIIPQQIQDIQQYKKNVIDTITLHNPYSNLFKIVHDDPNNKIMIYIPKTEINFWHFSPGNMPKAWQKNECANIPFYVSILTGKPAVFGLPDHANGCETFHHGYEAYTEDEFTASSKNNYSNDELCREVNNRGFAGYYRVTISDGAQKYICKTFK